MEHYLQYARSGDGVPCLRPKDLHAAVHLILAFTFSIPALEVELISTIRAADRAGPTAIGPADMTHRDGTLGLTVQDQEANMAEIASTRPTDRLQPNCLQQIAT